MLRLWLHLLEADEEPSVRVARGLRRDLELVGLVTAVGLHLRRSHG